MKNHPSGQGRKGKRFEPARRLWSGGIGRFTRRPKGSSGMGKVPR